MRTSQASGCGRLARGALEQVVPVEAVAVPLSRPVRSPGAFRACSASSGKASGRSERVVMIFVPWRGPVPEHRQDAGHLLVGDDDVTVRDGHSSCTHSGGRAAPSHRLENG